MFLIVLMTQFIVVLKQQTGLFQSSLVLELERVLL